MRPIDADALMERYGEPCHSFADVIEDMPTLDYAPVRHAYWKPGDRYETCSFCNYEHSYLDPLGYSNEDDYCPNCGAKMDWKGDDHEQT